ncbi:GAF domain-containing sensor histidine kinase [Actinoplanes solisilvae]|uniref:GAF domain-containing sensor histidine kinase n=1 Tax=Actinoplanes solisilvae TaxID=2486853 RepID=UPI000FDC4F1B|nr:GAF domain-containing protein [Actinoplanes solisilvae]
MNSSLWRTRLRAGRRPAWDTERLILETERKALLRLGALAGSAPIQELFDAMAEELGRIVDIETGATFQDMAGVSRFDPDGLMTLVAKWGRRPDWPSPLGSRWSLDGDSANARVFRTGRPARLEGNIPVTGSISRRLDSINAMSSVAVPIFVDNRLWGSATVVSDRPRRLPANTESRLSGFAALASTAISSAQRREEVQRLSDEHAAMRRVATMVARQAPPDRICQTVTEELAALLGVEDVRIFRYDPGGAATVVGSWGKPAGGSTHESPILIGERLWGVLTVTSSQPGPVPDRVQQTISDCIDLIATAVHNTDAEEKLRASRKRIVTATDHARRRFERDLHDGAQQRLVALALELRDTDVLQGQALAETAGEVDSILTDLRGLTRGLHPAVLSQSGLSAAVRSLVRHCPVPVTLTLPGSWAGVDDLVEIACYYVVAEALTNVAKHARASVVELELAVEDPDVRVTVSDDGVGGADAVAGTGLLGIADRVEALGGSLAVVSPRGEGTRLVARVPSARRSTGSGVRPDRARGSE